MRLIQNYYTQDICSDSSCKHLCLAWKYETAEEWVGASRSQQELIMLHQQKFIGKEIPAVTHQQQRDLRHKNVSQISKFLLSVNETHQLSRDDGAQYLYHELRHLSCCMCWNVTR